MLMYSSQGFFFSMLPQGHWVLDVRRSKLIKDVYVDRFCYLDCARRYRQLKQQLDMKCEEAEILQTKLQQSSYHKQQEELETLHKTIGT